MANPLYQSGGAFLPGVAARLTSSDPWNFDQLPTAGTDANQGVQTLVSNSSTQTLTNKTLTAPVLGGSVTGTYTLAGTPTITAPTINSPVLSTLKSNFSTATVSAGYAADTYLAGSAISLPTGGFVAGTRYVCTFDMVKTAAGTAAFTITVRFGTAGTTADTAIITAAFGAGTAAADTGTFEVFGHFRTVGSGTAAVLVVEAFCSHALAATGLISTGAAGVGQVTTVSSGFDSTPAGSILGISVNGGASFSGTNTIVETELHGF